MPQSTLWPCLQRAVLNCTAVSPRNVDAGPDYMQKIYPGLQEGFGVTGWCALLPEAKPFDAGVVVN